MIDFKRHVVTATVGFGFLLGLTSMSRAQENGKVSAGFTPDIPKMWDDAAMATLEIPLANPIGSPKHVPADYYTTRFRYGQFTKPIRFTRPAVSQPAISIG